MKLVFNLSSSLIPNSLTTAAVTASALLSLRAITFEGLINLFSVK